MKYLKNPPKTQWSDLVKRPGRDVADVQQKVNQIFRAVRQDGDAAVNKFTQLFDGSSPKELEVTEEEIQKSARKVPGKLKRAIALAKKNIEVFHEAQRNEGISVETAPGVFCWQEKKPIEKIGLYIPGGTAPLFSTILMLAVPARIAGCQQLVLCTPPDRAGTIDPVILYTANLCGIRRIFKAGGIQAIAAMTFGTESIPAVYKIFGPGNQFVTAAKQEATKYKVAIDMPAGPSELMVVADDSAVPEFIASDLLSQAEHGPDSQVFLISLSDRLVGKVQEELGRQLAVLPRRAIAEVCIRNSTSILLGSKIEALELVNAYAPEHLSICTEDQDSFAKEIINAGSVFLGNHTPESAGDYASGTNHTLPTNGYSKQYSGITLESFLKTISFQRISETGIKTIGPAVETMAEAEGLQAHKNAVSLRLEAVRKKDADV